MNPPSWLPLAVWGEFTQPSLRLLFHVCTYNVIIGESLALCTPLRELWGALDGLGASNAAENNYRAILSGTRSVADVAHL